MLKILTILQARMSSSRLPGKVIKPLLGEAMILRQLERMERSSNIGKIIIATSTDPSDDPLAGLLEEHDYDVFRGSLTDVLDRYYQAASQYSPEHVVRITGDCPMIDPQIIDRVIQSHLEQETDYTSNINPPTFPDGMDIEIFRFSVLQTAWEQARLPSEREHVTLFIRNHPERFSIFNVEGKTNLSALRLTVDEPADLELAEKIYAGLYPNTPDFGIQQIIEFLDSHPELGHVNAHIERNEGLKKSLRNDPLPENKSS